MDDHSIQPIDYRGVSILIRVEPTDDGVFGHADLFAKDQFKGRLSVGAGRAQPDDVRRRLRCLAKAKVDTWRLIGACGGR